jgi:mannose-1-phosphate guanylyltransferase/mannose-6-phosphate isomerase
MSDMLPITPVILCGGSGTRLWPLSRAGFPKQFLCLTGSHSLFQEAALRLVQLSGDDTTVAPPIVVSSEEHRFLVAEQLREVAIPSSGLILEPAGRNTAPALTMAALAAAEGGGDPVLVVSPADHAIANNQAFLMALRQAVLAAANGTMVILGITPVRPETGYGYVQVAKAGEGDGARGVECFVEKPDATTAQQYLDAGSYYWNAGLFVMRASAWLRALEAFRPDILNASRAAWTTRRTDGGTVQIDATSFAAIPAESVDYAVMERCPNSEYPLQLVRLDAGWSDLGAWDAVWALAPKDADGNAVVGDVILAGARNSMVHASGRQVSVVGLDNVVVVETPDAVLVANRSSSQEVKAVVQQLLANQRPEATLPRKVHRPWGWYDSVEEDDGFKVKRIHVHPKATLSLQKHQHRAEHWVVVRGTAEVTIGDSVQILTENHATFITLGAVHRLANPGDGPLEIIEVQLGSYLGEDDIVRLQDKYGRLG